MVALNPNKSCLTARPYYYDFLHDQDRESIPESVSEHIIKCQHCRDETKRLNSLLLPAGTVAGSVQNRRGMAIENVLKLHFAYIGELVACKSVRPFLPALAVSSLEIRIPTPITAHLDKCEACSKDLDTLRSLGLADKQLYRLGQLFAGTPTENTVSCSQAQAAAMKTTLIEFRKNEAAILKHLCTCSDCRKALYHYREGVRSDLLNGGGAQTEFPCEEVSATDIFDYCIPYGIDPANDEYAKFRESLASHLRTCPECLAKMQQLHETVYGIAERADSGIITRFELASVSEKAELGEVEGLYADWPIRVRVLGSSKSEEADYDEAGSAVLPFASNEETRALRLKWLVKPLAAAAAVLIIAMLFFTGPPAGALDFGEVYGAIARLNNVRITNKLPDESEIVYETWLSRFAGVKLQINPDQAFIFELDGTRRIIDRETGAVQTDNMSADLFNRIKDSVTKGFGLVPFSPEKRMETLDAQWNRVDNIDAEAVLAGTEVYDLTWTQKSGRYNKRRYFIDSITKLPRRVEAYSKISIQNDYEPTTVLIVTYPTDVEFQAVLQRFSSQH